MRYQPVQMPRRVYEAEHGPVSKWSNVVMGCKGCGRDCRNPSHMKVVYAFAGEANAEDSARVAHFARMRRDRGLPRLGTPETAEQRAARGRHIPAKKSKRPPSPLQVIQGEATEMGIEAICRYCVQWCPPEETVGLSETGDCLRKLGPQSAFGICADWETEKNP